MAKGSQRDHKTMIDKSLLKNACEPARAQKINRLRCKNVHSPLILFALAYRRTRYLVADTKKTG